MAIVAHSYRFIVGVDTHAKNHVLSILECITGAQIVCHSFANTPSGHARARAWIAKHTKGECLMVCVWEPNPHKEMDQNDYCGETRSGR